MAGNVEAWVLLSLALFTILVRIFVRWKLVGPANFQLDDYLMPLAGVCSYVFLCVVYALRLSRTDCICIGDSSSISRCRQLSGLDQQLYDR
jgi:hypothetical protein